MAFTGSYSSQRIIDPSPEPDPRGGDLRLVTGVNQIGLRHLLYHAVAEQGQYDGAHTAGCRIIELRHLYRHAVAR